MEEKSSQNGDNRPRAKDLLSRIQKEIGPEQEPASREKSIDEDPLIGKRKPAPDSDGRTSDETFSLEDFYGYTPLTRENTQHESPNGTQQPGKRREPFRRAEKAEEKAQSDYEYDLMSIFGMEEREQSGPSEDESEDEDGDGFDGGEDDSRPEEGIFAKTRKKYVEYTGPAMKSGIFADYRGRLIRILIDLGLCLLLGIFVFAIEYSEKLPFNLPGFLNISAYPTVGVLLEIQVIVLATALKAGPFLRGGLNLILGHASAESVYFLGVLSALMCYFVQLAGSSGEICYFGLMTLLSAFLFSLWELVNLIYELRSFRIVSSKKEKKVIHRMNRTEAKMEMAQMSRYLPYKNKFLSVQQTEQVGSYFRNLGAPSSADGKIRYLVLGALILALGFGLFSFFTGSGVSDAVFIGCVTLMLALPLSAYFCCSYPMYMLSLRAKDEDSAVIGGAALDNYLAPATLTFSDADIYPPKGVHLRSVKLYGSMPYDRVLCIAAAVLCPTGGSLGKVLESIIESDSVTDDMEFLSVSDDGIEAAVDGMHVLMGSYHYIVRNRLPMPIEDDPDEKNSVQMFMAVDNEVAARLLLTYTPAKSFRSSLMGLFESGMTVVVKTFDPNIDLSLLCATLQIDERQPIKVIHTQDPLELYEVKKSVESPIVTLGGISSLTETLRHAARTRHVMSICTALAAVSVGLAGVIMAVVLRLSDPAQIPVYYLALYQLFWLIPGIVISRLFS